jgi:hypothetical protein
VSILLGQVLPAVVTAVVTAVVSLLVMESYQTTPWLAEKLMRWSVRLSYVDNPERAQIREEELIGLLDDLPTLFKPILAGWFLLRAFAYRLANRRSHATREPLVRRSLSASFRIALVRAGAVVVGTGTVFGLEVRLVDTATYFNEILLVSLGVGVLAAIESVARSSRFYPGFIGGTTGSLLILALNARSPGLTEIAISLPFFCLAFGVATALGGASTRTRNYFGVIIGALMNIGGIALAELLPSPTGSLIVQIAGVSALGLAIGVLAGFGTTVEHRVRGMIGNSHGEGDQRHSRP